MGVLSRLPARKPASRENAKVTQGHQQTACISRGAQDFELADHKVMLSYRISSRKETCDPE